MAINPLFAATYPPSWIPIKHPWHICTASRTGKHPLYRRPRQQDALPLFVSLFICFEGLFGPMMLAGLLKCHWETNQETPGLHRGPSNERPHATKTPPQALTDSTLSPLTWPSLAARAAQRPADPRCSWHPSRAPGQQSGSKMNKHLVCGHTTCQSGSFAVLRGSEEQQPFVPA